ncbi:Hypothetical protein, putative [Bodo saltans]|uniref:Uncharacterized protein n=1 Tax=Bodo saltans TaxID=75058 RepID=A0A0S4IMV3_BODSA|nr:Hypothetical protein, putative [Bodo saltans]|eukprot:CUE73285.1 Hypothetical protein, putative [Bodo saltans]
MRAWEWIGDDGKCEEFLDKQLNKCKPFFALTAKLAPEIAPETRDRTAPTVMFAKPFCETRKWHYATVMFVEVLRTR